MEGSPWKLGTRGGDRSLEADSAEIAGCCSRTAEYAWTANATNPHHALPCHLPCPSYSTYCQDQPKPNLSLALSRSALSCLDPLLYPYRRYFRTNYLTINTALLVLASASGAGADPDTSSTHPPTHRTPVRSVTFPSHTSSQPTLAQIIIQPFLSSARFFPTFHLRHPIFHI